MTKTGLEFRILVIVICYLEFLALQYFSTCQLPTASSHPWSYKCAQFPEYVQSQARHQEGPLVAGGPPSPG